MERYRYVLVLIFFVTISALADKSRYVVVESGGVLIRENRGAPYIIDDGNYLGYIFRIEEAGLKGKGSGDYVAVGKYRKILFDKLIPISSFKKADPEKYLNGCFKIHYDNTETDIVNESGKLTAFELLLENERSTVQSEKEAHLYKYGKVVVLMAGQEIIFSSALGEKNNIELFSDPSYSDGEILYVEYDCIGGEWVNLKRPNWINIYPKTKIN